MNEAYRDLGDADLQKFSAKCGGVQDKKEGDRGE